MNFPVSKRQIINWTPNSNGIPSVQAEREKLRDSFVNGRNIELDVDLVILVKETYELQGF
jgi:hypothetical protein